MRGLGTHASRLTPPSPNDPSPVAPSLPRPRTPVVELLILRAFGVGTAVVDPELPEAGLGLVAERTEVGCDGTEEGTGAAGTEGRGVLTGFGEAPDKERRSECQRNCVEMGVLAISTPNRNGAREQRMVSIPCLSCVMGCSRWGFSVEEGCSLPL